MCCLFGFVDYGHKLTLKQRNRLLSILATSCEARGTDATGISYNIGNRLKVFKRPLPAHLMWYRVPLEATVVMGHTRMTTQGSEKKNENNHPFLGRTEMGAFALAHNGVLYNDKLLRKARKLPDTKIETDSYVAAQLVEQSGKLDFDSLKNMAEQLEGTFTITALSQQDELFFVKGNNPLCIFHFPQQGIYIYASTEEILQKALNRTKLRLGKMERVRIYSGEILSINAQGKVSKDEFDDSGLYTAFSGFLDWPDYQPLSRPYTSQDYEIEDPAYIRDLKAVASCFGVYPEDIDALLADGVTPEEIEEYLYCG